MTYLALIGFGCGIMVAACTAVTNPALALTATGAAALNALALLALHR